MNKARKPISFLLALVMILSLVPMTVLADLTDSGGSGGKIINGNNGTAQGVSSTCTVKPSTAGFYLIKATGSAKAGTPAITMSMGSGATKSVALNTSNLTSGMGTYDYGVVCYLEAVAHTVNVSLTGGTGTPAEQACSVTMSPYTNSSSVSVPAGKPVVDVRVFSNSNGYPELYQAVKGSAQVQELIGGVGNSVGPLAGTNGDIICVPARSSVGVVVTATGGATAYNVAFNKLTAPGSCHPNGVNDKDANGQLVTNNYFQFYAQETGLYILNTTATYASNLKDPTLTMPSIQPVGVEGTISSPLSETNIGSSTYFAQKSSAGRTSKAGVYTLTAGTTYLISLTNNVDPVYRVSLSLTQVPHIKGTGGSASMNNIALYDTNNSGTFDSYNPSFFSFTPSTTGWYTFTSANRPVTLTDIADTVANGEPNGWSGNLMTWDSYTVGASGYFKRDTTYIFKVDPTPQNGLKGVSFSTPDVTTNITVRQANFPRLETAGTAGVKITLAKDAVNWVQFTPSVNTPFEVVKADAPAGSWLTADTVTGSNVLKVYKGTSAGISEESSLGAKYEFKANTTYYLQFQSGNNELAAKSATVYLRSDSVQTDTAGKVWVYSPVNKAAGKDGFGESAATVMLGGQIIKANDDNKTYALTPGVKYTLTGVAPGCYDRTVEFIAGEQDPYVILYPRPEKPELDNTTQPANYTFTVTPPTAGSNVVNIKIGVNFTEDTTPSTTGYKVGVKIPEGDIATYGFGSTAYAALGKVDYNSNTGAYWIDPFESSTKSAWIKVVYKASGVPVVSGNETASAEVIYKLDVSGVTKLVKKDGDVEYTQTSIVIPNAKVTGKAVNVLKKGELGSSDDKLVTGIKSASMYDSYISIVKNNSTLAGYLNTGRTLMKGLFDKQNTADDGKTLNWNNYYKVDTDTAIYNNWEELAKNSWNTVVVEPVLDVQLTDCATTSSPSKIVDPTFSITAYNRILVTSGTTVPSVTGTKWVSNRDEKGNLLTQTQLAKVVNPTATDLTTVDIKAKINALQMGAWQKVTVNDPVFIKIGLGALSGSSKYVTHTKDNGAVYVYELNVTDKTYNDSNQGFVSPYGLSTFKVSDTQPSGYKAAYILRQTDVGLAKIWYKSPQDAIADVETGESIFLNSGYWGMPIDASSTKANGFVLIALDSNNKPTDMTSSKITVAGKELTYATVAPTGGTAVVAAIYGSGATVTTNNITVLTAAAPSLGGGVTVSNNKATASTNVTYTVNTNTNNGYRFAYVTVRNNATNTVLYTFYTTTGSFQMPANGDKVTVTATFTGGSANMVNLVQRVGGALSVSPSAAPQPGTLVTVTATANAGGKLTGITAVNTSNNTSVVLTQSSGNSNQYTFIMPAGGVTVTPTWSNTVTGILMNNTTGGALTLLGTSTPSAGSAVAFTAAPSAGYNLTKLKITDSNGTELNYTRAGSMYSFQMPASGGVSVTPTWSLAGMLPYYDLTDITAPGNSWARSAVQTMYDKGIMTGSSGSFLGNTNISRAELWTVCARLKGRFVTSAGYPWYTEAQSWVVSNRVSDGKNADGAITREELATMLYRLAGNPSTNGSYSSFPDANKVSKDWADSAMRWAVQNKILSGNHGYLNPGDNATRYEVAVMLTRYCNLMGI